MNKLLVFVFLLLVISACTDEPQVPANVLPKDVMVKIVKDLHLTEAYVNANYPYSDSAKYVYVYLEDSILKARGTDKKNFDSSLVYYESNLKQMDEIYAAAVDSLSLLEGIGK